MKHKDLLRSIAVKTALSEEEVESCLQAVSGILRTEIASGNIVSFQGFGSFELRRKEERLSVHPATKARTLIPPKLVVNFRQSTTFKAKLKELPRYE